MFFFDTISKDEEDYAFKKQNGAKPITHFPTKWNSYYECRICGKRIGDIVYNFCPSCGYKILWSSPRCLTGYPNIDQNRGNYRYLPDDEELQSRRRCAIRAMCGTIPRFTRGMKGIAYDIWDCGYCGAVAKIQNNYCWKCGGKHHWNKAINTLTDKRKQYYTDIRSQIE